MPGIYGAQHVVHPLRNTTIGFEYMVGTDNKTIFLVQHGVDHMLPEWVWLIGEATMEGKDVFSLRPQPIVKSRYPGYSMNEHAAIQSGLIPLMARTHLREKLFNNIFDLFIERRERELFEYLVTHYGNPEWNARINELRPTGFRRLPEHPSECEHEVNGTALVTLDTIAA